MTPPAFDAHSVTSYSESLTRKELSDFSPL